MKIVSASEMRELDRLTMEEAGVPGAVLMETAGSGLASYVEYVATACGFEHILLIAGRGNNGGDVFVAAYTLRQLGFDPEVWLACEASALRGDARTHFRVMTEHEVQWHEFPAPADWQEAIERAPRFDLIVDGLLGTGTRGPARGVAAAGIAFINSRRDESWIVAVDVPSGLNADDGTARGGAVFADMTVAMGLPKSGLLRQPALEYVGTLETVDLGIPPEYVDAVEGEPGVEFISFPDVSRWLPARQERAAHKGLYGHVALIGGTPGYSGAMIMAARAALCSGAGLVSVFVPEASHPIVAGAVPEAMVHVLSDEPDWNAFDAVLAGPGLGRSPEMDAFIGRLVDRSRVPLVLDADAFAPFEGRLNLLKKARCPLILTPHPGEAARLLDCTADSVQENRRAAARELSEKSGAVSVLKGAGTLVAESSGWLRVNMTGNPGMACGGCGDVLAGLLTGLVAQMESEFDASALAVWLHGAAGDLAALDRSRLAMKATDIIGYLPDILRLVSVR